MLLRENTGHQTAEPVPGRVRVLVLCTGNSARSVMAEAILNSVGAELFQAYSAGSHPTGRVNPLALEQIARLDLSETLDIRSKSWHEFSGPLAPELDLVLTVCDNAASETCPASIGKIPHIHWGLPDPAGVSADIQIERAAFARCFWVLHSRVEALVSTRSLTRSRETLFNTMRKLACYDL